MNRTTVSEAVGKLESFREGIKLKKATVFSEYTKDKGKRKTRIVLGAS